MKIPFVLSLGVVIVGLGYCAVLLRKPIADAPQKGPAKERQTATSGPGSSARHGSARQEPKQPTEPSEWMSVKRELAHLRAEMKVLRGQSIEDVAREPPDPSQEEARLRQERREYLEQLVESFPNELVDRSWASETQHAIDEALQVNGLRRSTDGVECRSETCRVELVVASHEDMHAMSMFVLEVGQALPKVDYAHVDDGEGNRKTIMYMSRHDDP